MVRLSGGLLIGSSANKTAGSPPQAVCDLSDELMEQVDVILDDGATFEGLPSTVVDLTSASPKILREGPVSYKSILDALAFSY